MKKKTFIRSLLTIFAISLVLGLFSACHQKSSSEEGKQLSAEDYAKKMASLTMVYISISSLMSLVRRVV